MIYVMSDIHGNAIRFNSIMEQIDLQPEDTLYILGDVIDRYPDGIRILRLLMSMPNVQMLLGNHEYGTENKYRKALLMVLKDAINDQYDYIDWWLYEGAPDYKIWNEDESIEWDLTEPEALYDFITIECK